MVTAGHVAAFLDRGMPLELRSLVEELYRYTLQSDDNAEVLHDFPERVVRVLIALHFSKGTLIYHRDHRHEIDGLLMFYRCNQEWTWEDIREWKADDPKGDSFFLAFLWAGPGAMKDMCIDLIRKVPEVITHKLLGLREKKDGPKLVRYDQRVLVKILKQ